MSNETKTKLKFIILGIFIVLYFILSFSVLMTFASYMDDSPEPESGTFIDRFIEYAKWIGYIVIGTVLWMAPMIIGVVWFADKYM